MLCLACLTAQQLGSEIPAALQKVPQIRTLIQPSLEQRGWRLCAVKGKEGGVVMFYVALPNFVANVGLWRLAFECTEVVATDGYNVAANK